MTKSKDALEQAQAQGYLIAPAGNTTLPGLYFEWCEANNMPYLCVLTAAKKSTVKLDLLSTSPDPRQRKQLPDTALPSLKVLYERFPTTSHQDKGYGSSWFTHPDVPPDEAEALAEALLALYQATAVPVWQLSV